MQTYSFIQHPLKQFISKLDGSFMGIQEGYAIYLSSSKNLRVSSFINDTLQDKKLSVRLTDIQKWRRTKAKFEWINEEDVAFLRDNKTSKKIKQLTFIDELETDLLAMKFLNPIDNNYDILLLKIKKNQIFNVVKSSAPLTSDEKEIIGKSIYPILKMRFEEEIKNLQTHQMILKNIGLIQSQLEKQSTEVKVLQTNYKESVVFYIESILKDLSNRIGTDIKLSERGLQFLLDAHLEIKRMESVLTDAAHLALNLTLDLKQEVIINAENIIIPEEKKEETKQVFENKYQAVIDILNKYENAANKALNEGYKVNGSTVAKLCAPSVSPAAITFNIRKYSKSINILMERYDDKWELLRTQFKPVMNILKQQKTSKIVKKNSA